jgi:hypothetical protein
VARYGLAAKAQTLRRLSPDRRTATLLAALWQLEFDATDDALIVLDQVTGLLLSHAAREHKDRRYAQLSDLDQAARRLRAAVLVLLDPPAGGIEELWSAIGRHVSRSELELAAATVHQLASRPDATDGQDAAFRGELLRRYQSLRRFLPALLETICFDAAPAGRPVLDALESLRALEGRPGRVSASSVSLKVVTGRWRHSCSTTRSSARASSTAATTRSACLRHCRRRWTAATRSSRAPDGSPTHAPTYSAVPRGRPRGPRSAPG